MDAKKAKVSILCQAKAPICILKTGSQSAEILKIVLKMARKELNLIWGKNPLWFGCTQTMLYSLKAWLLKWVHALEEGKAEHPLAVTEWVQPHTPVSHQRFATLWIPRTHCSCGLSGQIVFLSHAHKLNPVKTALAPRLFWPSVLEHFWIFDHQY